MYRIGYLGSKTRFKMGYVLLVHHGSVAHRRPFSYKSYSFTVVYTLVPTARGTSGGGAFLMACSGFKPLIGVFVAFMLATAIAKAETNSRLFQFQQNGLWWL